jgi:predicted TIM-barrel fold metal-dependent hydrolase
VLFDAHLHVIDPRFPLRANRGFVPEPFTVDDYRAAVDGLGIGGGAVVSGSFQGEDQEYLRDALGRLGPAFVGVTNLPEDASDALIVSLAGAGVRAARVNLRRGAPTGTAAIRALAERVHDVAGWHVELYADSATLDADDLAVLARLPRVVIDHLGLSEGGLPGLVRFAAAGGHVKATGFGRLDLDVPTALRAIHRANPRALVFGTDLPGTRAPRRFRAADIDLVRDALGEDGARRVLRDNAVALYRPRIEPSIGAPVA